MNKYTKRVVALKNFKILYQKIISVLIKQQLINLDRSKGSLFFSQHKICNLISQLIVFKIKRQACSYKELTIKIKWIIIKENIKNGNLIIILKENEYLDKG